MSQGEALDIPGAWLVGSMLKLRSRIQSVAGYCPFLNADAKAAHLAR